MATYADVVDRAFRDWLTRPDDQPLLMELDGALNSSDTSFSVDVTILTAEEQNAIGPGTLLEIDSELIRVKSYDNTSGSEQVTDCVRGVLSTTAASHDDGTEVVISPDTSRIQVFQAVRDVVQDCFPTLYVIDTEQITTPGTSKAWTDANADAIDPIAPAFVQVSNSDAEWGLYGVALLDPFPPATNDKAWAFPVNTPTNKTAHVTFRKKATVPSDESADLPDDTWERMLTVGAVAHLIGGEDVEMANAQFLTEQLEVQSFQAGQGDDLRSRLLGYYEYLKQQARRRLESQHGIPVKENGYVVRGG